MGQADRRLRAMRKRQMLRYGAALALALVVVIAVIWLPSQFEQRKQARKNSQYGTEQATRALETGEFETADFAKYISNFNAPSLKVLAEGLPYDTTASFIVQMNRINQNVLIAERLLSLNPEQELWDFATKLKLNALIVRELLMIENEVSDGRSTRELIDFAATIKPSSESAFVEKIALANVLTATSQFVSESSLSQRHELRNSALSVFQSVASQGADNPKLAKELYRVVVLIQSRSAASESAAFAQNFMDVFGYSKNPTISELVKELRYGVTAVDERLIDVINVVASRREQAVQELMAELDIVLSGSEIAPEVVDSALKRGRDLVRLGKRHEASQVAQKLTAVPGLSNDAQHQLIELERQIAVLNIPFDPTGILDLMGEPLTLDSNKVYIMPFVATDAEVFQQSISSYQQLITTINARSVLEPDRLQVVLVFVRMEGDGSSFRSLEELATRRDLPLYTVDPRQEFGRQFQTRFPLDSLPITAIVKHRQGVPSVTALNPPADQIDEYITK